MGQLPNSPFSGNLRLQPTTMRNLIGAILLFFSLLSFSQDDEPRVINSVREWLEEINNWPDSAYRQNNLRIRMNYELDSGLIATSFDELGQLDMNAPRFSVNKSVNVFGLDFFGPTINGYHGRWLTNIHFKEEFSFYRSQDSRLGFKNCIFDDLVQPRLSQSRFWIRFEDCHFKSHLIISDSCPTNTFLVTYGNTDAVFFPGHSTPSFASSEIARSSKIFTRLKIFPPWVKSQIFSQASSIFFAKLITVCYPTSYLISK